MGTHKVSSQNSYAQSTKTTKQKSGVYVHKLQAKVQISADNLPNLKATSNDGVNAMRDGKQKYGDCKL